MLRDIVQQPRFKQDSNGILKFYDSNRNKYLSATRGEYSFGINHINLTHSRWMMATGGVLSNITGYKIPRDATITAISVQTKSSVADCSFNVRINNTVTNLVSVSMSGEISKVIDNLDVDLTQNDWIQLYMTVNAGKVDYPILVIELAWR